MNLVSQTYSLPCPKKEINFLFPHVTKGDGDWQRKTLQLVFCQESSGHGKIILATCMPGVIIRIMAFFGAL